MIYYGMITLSVMMFSMQFFFNQLFEKSYGNGAKAVFVFSAGGGISGLITLFLINGLSWEYTHFSMLMAIWTAVNGMLFTFCSLKAFGKINLSLYSLFSMLGGMALPFVSGILFHHEGLTLGKCLCFVILTIALCLTVEKGETTTGNLYYIGIFVLNGMAGVISKIFQAAPFEKTSAAGYSVLTAMVSILISLVMLWFYRSDKKKLNKTAIFSMLGHGILNRVANLLLLIALGFLPASAQYPFVTGGVMICSTVISCFTPNKPRKKEIGAVILSFIGILALILLP